MQSIRGEQAEAVKAFTRSLELNEYQSHAHFRRAVSYFNLGEYEKSMQDLNAARALGLDEKECKSLNDRLVEKFGMKV